MRCEMCGKDETTLVTISVEGSVLKVCTACRRFGRVLDTSRGSATPLPRGPAAREVVETRLADRTARRTERDLFAELPEMELAPDWPRRIRSARERMGLSQEKFGQLLNEKTSVIHKLEAGSMTPPDALVRKIERTLKIRIRASEPAA